MPPHKHVAVTHFRPQVSDLLALYLLKIHGDPTVYANIEEGLQTRYLRDGGHSLRDEHGEFRDAEDSQHTYFGVGGGKYDEHGKRLLGCEASLIARDLGLLRDLGDGDNLLPEELRQHTFMVRDRERSKTFFVEDSKLRDVFAAVVRDDISGSPPFSFGNLTDTVYGLYPEGMRRVASWVFRMFEAAMRVGPIPKAERDETHKETVDFLLATLARIEQRKNYHERAGKRIRGYLEKRRTIVQFEPLDLVDAVAVMRRAGANWRKWMLVPLRAELAEQHHFHTVTAEEAKKAQLQNITLRIREVDGDRLERRVIALVETDDPYVHRYLFSAEFGCDAAFVLRRNSKGQTQVFPGGYRKETDRGKKTRYIRLSFGPLMPTVAAFIRYMECRKRQVTVPAWDELISDHGPKNELTWFFYSKPGWLMNGSLTATEVPSTKLSLKEIKEALVWAVDDVYREKRKIIISRLKMEGQEMKA